MVLLVVLLESTVPTVGDTRTMLALVRFAVRVGDQVFPSTFPGKESLLAQRTLVRLQTLMDVSRVFQKITGRRESLTALLAHVRLLLRVGAQVDPQVRLRRPLVRTQFALERLHGGVHSLVAGHGTRSLERLVTRLTRKGTFAGVGSKEEGNGRVGHWLLVT